MSAGLSAEFVDELGEPSVSRQGRDRWIVVPAAIQITDHRPSGGKFQLYVTPRGTNFSSMTFDLVWGFALDEDPAVVDVAVAPERARWVRPNETVVIAQGVTTGMTTNIVIRMRTIVHSPTGEPPIDFALELMPIETVEYE